MGQRNLTAERRATNQHTELTAITVADRKGTLCASCDLSLKEYTRVIVRAHQGEVDGDWRVDSTYCLECGPDSLEYPTDAHEVVLSGHLDETADDQQLELRGIEVLAQSPAGHSG